MQGVFEFAAGSVPGRDHVLIAKNNQDARHVLSLPDLSVAVVCDGCGDSNSRYSEMGAILGSQLMVEAIVRNARRIIHSEEPRRISEESFWERVRQDVLAQLRVIALQLGGSLTQVVTHDLLFTTVVALITPRISVFATIGDGIIIVNGEQIPVDKYPENKPPYMAYGLVDSTIPPEFLRFRIWKTLETEWLSSFLIGSDGVEDLIASAEKNIPGREELVGPVSQFWENDRYFANSDALRQRFTVINRNVDKIRWDERRVDKNNGLFHDDTTIVVGRRPTVQEDTSDD